MAAAASGMVCFGQSVITLLNSGMCLIVNRCDAAFSGFGDYPAKRGVEMEMY